MADAPFFNLQQWTSEIQWNHQNKQNHPPNKWHEQIQRKNKEIRNPWCAQTLRQTQIGFSPFNCSLIKIWRAKYAQVQSQSQYECQMFIPTKLFCLHILRFGRTRRSIYYLFLWHIRLLLGKHWCNHRMHSLLQIFILLFGLRAIYSVLKWINRCTSECWLLLLIQMLTLRDFSNFSFQPLDQSKNKIIHSISFFFLCFLKILISCSFINLM